MSFGHPWVLALLAIPILLLAREWKGRGQKVVLPLDHGFRPRGRLLAIFLHAAQSMVPLALAVVLILLAGPRQWSQPQSKRVLTNIQFCLDVSGSMTAQFGDGTRSDGAMESINRFIKHRKGDSFGLTIFGSSVLHWVPLTSDPSAFECAGPFLRPEKLPSWFGGGTMIGMALKECLGVLSAREEGDRMVILVTDGYSFDLDGGNDEAIARKLAAENVVVYTVHVAEGAPPDQMYTIANITGGQVFAAGDPDALAVVFERIDRMRGARMEKTVPETMDHFRPWCLAGLGAAGLALLSLFGARYTPW